MQPRLLAAVAAMILVPAGVLLAAEIVKPPEAKPAVPPATEKNVTFMGVAVIPARPALESQLGLPRGTGLVVVAVAPDSPAAKAGLLKYDVLQKLDDQLLIGPRQLQVLVRMHNPGDAVKLALIRGGKTETASLALASTPAKDLMGFHHHFWRHGHGFWRHMMMRGECGMKCQHSGATAASKPVG